MISDPGNKSSSDEYDSDAGSADSDKELQIAFASGLIKPGLFVADERKEEKQCINDVRGLKQALQELKKDLPWIERMDVTVDPLEAPKPMEVQLGGDPDDLTGDAIHDDFKREMKFYRQAQAAALQGLAKLHRLDIPTKRPDDYFAGMVKSDAHMKKVREKLISNQLNIERSEKAKKLRELRKYGKEVQKEVQEKRRKEKKEMMEAVKKFRKGEKDKLDFLDDKPGKKGKDKDKGKDGKKPFQQNRKRMDKNKKFGFGGQKKRSKYNTKESSADMSEFSRKKHSGKPSARGKNTKAAAGGNKNRPGKMRRQKMKTKKK